MRVEAIFLAGMPMPPSENMMYRNVAKIGRALTKEARQYQKEMQVWACVSNQKITHARLLFDNEFYLGIDVYLYFPKERIICKNGSPKKLDTANRLKALLDSVARNCGWDDCKFWNVSVHKLVSPNETSYVDAKIYALDAKGIANG